MRDTVQVVLEHPIVSCILMAFTYAMVDLLVDPFRRCHTCKKGN